jgi:membrane protein implicated in regulation of membrane protease activity
MLEAPLIVGIIFFSIVAVVKIVADANTRRKLMEKGGIDEQTRRVLIGQTELSALSNIKWGMVLVGIGVAAMVSEWLPYYWSDEGAIGLAFILAGLGFLIYYPIAQKRLKEIERREQVSGRPQA